MGRSTCESISPDSKIPPEEVQKFFDGLSQKNNLCVLTGDKTAMGSVEKAARQHFAAQKADGRIPKGHAQREDLERKQQSYEQDFNATILSLFDKVLFPIHRADRQAQLVSKALDMTRDGDKPFNGEEQIEKTLTSNPLKLYLDVEKEFDAIRDKAQDLLWTKNQDDARWSDVADRYAWAFFYCLILNKEGRPTRKGTQWHGAQVSAILKRLKLTK